MMKVKELRAMEVAELEAKVSELKKDLFFLRMQHATNQLDTYKPISLTLFKVIAESLVKFAKAKLEIEVIPLKSI